MGIGLPAGVQSVLYSVSNIVVQAAVNGFGTDAVAAWTAYGKLDGVFWMTVSAFGVAITTFVGQNFGAGLYDRMKKSVRVCLAMCAGTTVAMSALLLLGSERLLRLFSDDADVIAIGLRMMKLLVPTYITYVLIEILAGAVRGAGDSLIPTLMTLGGVCLLRVAWVLVVTPATRSIEATIWCYPITWTVTSILFAVYYRRGKWLERCARKAGRA